MGTKYHEDVAFDRAMLRTSRSNFSLLVAACSSDDANDREACGTCTGTATVDDIEEEDDEADEDEEEDEEEDEGVDEEEDEGAEDDDDEGAATERTELRSALVFGFLINASWTCTRGWRDATVVFWHCCRRAEGSVMGTPMLLRV
jgi:hypothetical protein